MNDALVRAAAAGDLARLVALASAEGADLEAAGETRAGELLTPLEAAAAAGATAAVEWLLKCGVATGALDDREYDEVVGSPLELAAAGGHVGAVRAIAARVALGWAAHRRGTPPPTKSRRCAPAPLLSKYKELPAPAHLQAALQLFAERGDLAAAEVLLSLGARADYGPKMWTGDYRRHRHFPQTTALHAAVEEGHLEMARLLLPRFDHGVQNADGETVLHLAAKLGRAAITALLLEPRAGDVSAANARLVELLRELVGTIDRQQLFNPTKENYFTPLMVAAAHGHADVVALLLAAGAETHGPWPWGTAALLLAVRGGHTAAAEALLDAKVDLCSIQWPICCTRGTSKWPRFRRLAFKKICGSDSSGNALHVAAEHGRLEVLRLLLAHGADAGAVDHMGRTAADVARRRHDALRAEEAGRKMGFTPAVHRLAAVLVAHAEAERAGPAPAPAAPPPPSPQVKSEPGAAREAAYWALRYLPFDATLLGALRLKYLERREKEHDSAVPLRRGRPRLSTTHVAPRIEGYTARGALSAAAAALVEELEARAGGAAAAELLFCLRVLDRWVVPEVGLRGAPAALGGPAASPDAGGGVAEEIDLTGEEEFIGEGGVVSLLIVRAGGPLPPPAKRVKAEPAE